VRWPSIRILNDDDMEICMKLGVVFDISVLLCYNCCYEEMDRVKREKEKNKEEIRTWR
jgi:hypothetical protein